MVSTPRSRKNKGYRLQVKVVEKLRDTFNLDCGLENFEGDIQPRVMGCSGTDVVLSPKAKSIIPFDFEIKNQEKWSVPQWWEQTLYNTGKDRKPALIIGKNRQEPLIILRLDDFLKFLGSKNRKV